ncbi:putative niacin/nicotinamide transporter NaiP [Clavibacter michiganensis]|uniref:Putative niacin/nicotinamide transporter NaiP n=1 Tax=Clavibacter michiganensis TaxID=28447 RepID=A0A251Y4X3_9MICO|nr:MFS transporter [Clavibacter michiganensis]OUE19326.1 putative niacin/nicotinamide transporter NaiP [Clavibacter michiganensis]
MTTTTSRPSRAQRLDRLPWTRAHSRILGGSGVGWALDAMDVGLISFVIAQLAVVWEADAGQLGLVASAGFLGMAIGASVGGLVADRIGRRQVFALTLLVYGVATGVSALAMSVGALIALRFVVGLGLGAELPVASTLVSEFSPARIRGRVIVILESSWAVGWTAAALIGYLVIPASDDGWRWALALGAVPAVWAIVVRLRLPESVRFLEATGRHREAERVVRDLERAAGADPTTDVADETTAEARAADAAHPADASAAEAAPRERLFGARLRRRTLSLWIVWFCVNFAYYGAFIWLPTLLVAQGFSLVRSFEYTLLITLAQLPGYAVSAWLVERWGRRVTLAVFLAGSAVSAGLFGTADSVTTILVFGALMSFSNLGAWGALYAVTPELYPTRVRATGAGSAAGFGRLASIVAPLCVPPLLALGGVALPFGVFAAVFALAAVAALTLPDLRGAALED